MYYGYGGVHGLFKPGLADVKLFVGAELAATFYEVGPVWRYCPSTHVRNDCEIIIVHQMVLR